MMLQVNATSPVVNKELHTTNLVTEVRQEVTLGFQAPKAQENP